MPMQSAQTTRLNEQTPPQSLAQMRTRLLDQHDSLSRRLKDVSQYIIDHPQSIALDTLAAIAEKAGVHPSTLVRFAHHFGFDGFSALQQLYKQHVEQNFNDYGERIRFLQQERGDDAVTPPQLLNEFAQANLLSLQHLRDRTDPDLLNRAVDLLDNTSAVHVCGIRRAFPVAMYFTYALSHVQVRCHAIDGLGLMHEEQARCVTADDVLIAITFAPYASVTHDVITRAKANQASVILLTDDQSKCPSAAHSDLVFSVPDAEVRSFRSLNSSLCLAQTLCIALGYRRETTTRDAVALD